MDDRDKVLHNCPQCGRHLSPWEQILLSVDRALMCKGCWNRIILDEFNRPDSSDSNNNKEFK